MSVANEHDCYWRRETHVLTAERDDAIAALSDLLEQFVYRDPLMRTYSMYSPMQKALDRAESVLHPKKATDAMFSQQKGSE